MEMLLDKLDVILKAERLGGQRRREALENIMIRARELGCRNEIGGGRAGGINMRYGSIRYAIMDINVRGEVKLYVQPHPGGSSPDALAEHLNSCIDETEGLDPKSFPIGTYGQLQDKVEDIPDDALKAYLAEAVDQIHQAHYNHYY